MTAAIRRTPAENFQYTFVLDANEFDHPVTEWAHNPNIDAMDDEPRQYWKWDEESSTVVPMSQAEMGLVDGYGKEVFADDGSVVTINVTDNFPKSTIDGKKLSVHTSYKPEIPDYTTFAIWTGAGDDLSDLANGLGNGDLLNIHSEQGTPKKHVDIKFNPAYGRVWIHEAYVKFSGGGFGDYMEAEIIATGVPLQQMANLDLVLDGNIIKYSTNGPGTGTHGFASAESITLIERSYSRDGDWDYIDGNLVPNFYGLGRYKMSTVDTVVNRFVNKLPCYGSCPNYFSMSSDETTELLPNYYARMTVHNVSDSDWYLSAIIEMYRVSTTL